MLEENKEYCVHKSHWLKTLGIMLAALIGAFLAFYFAVDMTLNRMSDPSYQMRKMEKMMKHEQKRLKKLAPRFSENPFEPRLAPMLVNLVKEPGEYKIIVDLKPLDGNEKNINVQFKEQVVTVSGEVEKKEQHREDIMNFSQSYYLDEKLNTENITKEKKGSKYVITIPYED